MIKKGNGFIAKIVFILLSALCLTPYIGSAVALLLGFVFVNFFENPFHSINAKLVSWLLKIAVVGLGFGMNMVETIQVGREGFYLTVFTLIVITLSALLFGKLFKTSFNISYLISVGTAICGGSAIAAVAPILKANKNEISISLGVIFLLNAIALIIFPPIGGLLDLSQSEFGMWSAIAIHDTSSVLGAAHIFGEEALKIATAVKMSRVLWIIPISIITVLIFNVKGRQIKIPWFILLFILAIVLNSYATIPTTITSFITTGSKSILVLALFFIGTSISIKDIKAAGLNSMALGISLWVIISVVSLSMILMGI